MYLFVMGICEGSPGGPIGTGASLQILHGEGVADDRDTVLRKVSEVSIPHEDVGTQLVADLRAAVDGIAWAVGEAERHNGFPAVVYTDSRFVEVIVQESGADAPGNVVTLVGQLLGQVHEHGLEVRWCPAFANRAKAPAKTALHTVLGKALPGWLFRGAANR